MLKSQVFLCKEKETGSIIVNLQCKDIGIGTKKEFVSNSSIFFMPDLAYGYFVFLYESVLNLMIFSSILPHQKSGWNTSSYLDVPLTLSRYLIVLHRKQTGVKRARNKQDMQPRMPEYTYMKKTRAIDIKSERHI